MRLYLAVALLMLAFVAYTDAQEDTTQEKFARFTEQVNAWGRGLSEKAETAFDGINTTDIVVKTGNFVREQYGKLLDLFHQQ